VADHLLLIEPDLVRAIEGNYDTYQMLEGRSRDGAAEESDGQDGGRAARSVVSRARSAKPDKSAKGPTARRRFPFRKVRDLEDEILGRETCIEKLQRELAEPSVVRDGERVRQIKAQIEEEQAIVKKLYEHWDEATELNW
jgi:ATP-binding cassette subfamily F protein 3